MPTSPLEWKSGRLRYVNITWHHMTSHFYRMDPYIQQTNPPGCEMWTHSVATPIQPSSHPGDKPRPTMASIGRAHQRRGAMHMYSVFRTSTLAWVDPNIARKLERTAPLIHHVWSFCPLQQHGSSHAVAVGVYLLFWDKARLFVNTSWVTSSGCVVVCQGPHVQVTKGL